MSEILSPRPGGDGENHQVKGLWGEHTSAGDTHGGGSNYRRHSLRGSSPR